MTKQRENLKRRKKRKVSFLIFMSLLICCIANAQVIDEMSKNLIIKNIISYHFRYAKRFELKLINNDVLEDKTHFFNDLWPTENNNLDIEVENININYPINQYNFYHIIKRGYRFLSDSTRGSFDFVSFSFDQDYLVAVSNINGYIKFLSGNF